MNGELSVADLAREVSAETGAPQKMIVGDLMELAQDLYLRGFLVNKRDEQYVGRPFTLNGVFLRVTDACNLRCTQCYADSFGSLKSKKNELTTEEIYTILRDVKEAGGKTVTLSGGEPLLRPDILDIVEYGGGQLGLNLKLNTNGTLLLPDGVVERIVPYVEELQISFDGCTAETHDAVRGKGSFASSIRGAKKYLAAGGRDTLIMCQTLMSSNIETALHMPVLAKELGARTVRYLNVVNDGRAVGTWGESFRPTNDQLVHFYDQLYFGDVATDGMRVLTGLQGFYPQVPDDFRDECFLCPVGLSPAISPQGDVFPCSVFEQPEHKLGNLREAGGISEVIETGMLQGFREQLRHRPKLIPECARCDWRGMCQSGCAAIADTGMGSTRQPDGYCEVREHLYTKLIFERGGNQDLSGNCSCVE